MSQLDSTFELCKEVYKRFPEWEDKQGFYLYQIVGEGAINKSLWFNTLSFKFDDKRKVVKAPLYTSDYLLEKLPSPELLIEKDRRGRWLVFDTERGTDFQFFSDTPLKALLKLTIALDDAGELK